MAGVDGCGEEKNLLPTPVFSWDTAATESNSLLQIFVLDLSLINLFGLAGNKDVIYMNWYYDYF